MTETYSSAPPPRGFVGAAKEEVLEGRLIALTRENEFLKSELRRAASSHNGAFGVLPPGSPASPLVGASSSPQPPPPSYSQSNRLRSPYGSTIGSPHQTPQTSLTVPPSDDGGDYAVATGGLGGHSTPPAEPLPPVLSGSEDPQHRYNQLYADYRRVMRQREEDKARHAKELTNVTASLKVAQLEKSSAAADRQRIESDLMKLTAANEQMRREMQGLEMHVRDQNQRMHDLQQQCMQLQQQQQPSSASSASGNAAASEAPRLTKKSSARKTSPDQADPVKLQAMIDHLQRLLDIRTNELARYEGRGPEMYPVAVQVGAPTDSTAAQTDESGLSSGPGSAGVRTPTSLGAVTSQSLGTITSQSMLASSLLVTTRPLEVHLLSQPSGAGMSPSAASATTTPPHQRSAAAGGSEFPRNGGGNGASQQRGPASHVKSGSFGTAFAMPEMLEAPMASSPRWSDEPTDAFPGDGEPSTPPNGSTSSLPPAASSTLRRQMNRSTTSAGSAGNSPAMKPITRDPRPAAQQQKPRSPTSQGAGTTAFSSRDAWGKGAPPPPSVMSSKRPAPGPSGPQGDRRSGASATL